MTIPSHGRSDDGAKFEQRWWWQYSSMIPLPTNQGWFHHGAVMVPPRCSDGDITVHRLSHHIEIIPFTIKAPRFELQWNGYATNLNWRLTHWSVRSFSKNSCHEAAGSIPPDTSNGCPLTPRLLSFLCHVCSPNMTRQIKGFRGPFSAFQTDLKRHSKMLALPNQSNWGVLEEALTEWCVAPPQWDGNNGMYYSVSGHIRKLSDFQSLR